MGRTLEEQLADAHARLAEAKQDKQEARDELDWAEEAYDEARWEVELIEDEINDLESAIREAAYVEEDGEEQEKEEQP